MHTLPKLKPFLYIYSQVSICKGRTNPYDKLSVTVGAKRRIEHPSRVFCPLKPVGSAIFSKLTM